jgi:hypothetical protein
MEEPSPTGATLAARTPSRSERLRAPLLTAGVVGGLTLALHVRDPHVAGSWGVCPWLLLTGYYCPGCGGLRAVNDLGNGDVVAAASSNLVFVASIPLLAFLWVRWTQRAWNGTQSAGSSRQTSLFLVALATAVMVAFAVLRNLPVGSWLAP